MNLKDLNISIKKFKYLFVGFKSLDNPLGVGHSKKKKNSGIKSFIRHTGSFPYKWQKNGGGFLPNLKFK